MRERYGRGSDTIIANSTAKLYLGPITDGATRDHVVSLLGERHSRDGRRERPHSAAHPGDVEWLSVGGDLTRAQAPGCLLMPSEPKGTLAVVAGGVERVDVVTGTSIRMRIARHFRERPDGNVTVMLPTKAEPAEHFLELLTPLPEGVSVSRNTPVVLAEPPRYQQMAEDPLVGSVRGIRRTSRCTIDTIDNELLDRRIAAPGPPFAPSPWQPIAGRQARSPPSSTDEGSAAAPWHEDRRPGPYVRGCAPLASPYAAARRRDDAAHRIAINPCGAAASVKHAARRQHRRQTLCQRPTSATNSSPNPSTHMPTNLILHTRRATPILLLGAAAILLAIHGGAPGRTAEDGWLHQQGLCL